MLHFFNTWKRIICKRPLLTSLTLCQCDTLGHFSGLFEELPFVSVASRWPSLTPTKGLSPNRLDRPFAAKGRVFRAKRPRDGVGEKKSPPFLKVTHCVWVNCVTYELVQLFIAQWSISTNWPGTMTLNDTGKKSSPKGIFWFWHLISPPFLAFLFLEFPVLL